jgi:hypothetical protein
MLYGGLLHGQQVNNIEATQLDENTIRVSYDLEGELPGQLFTVRLFSSANNFQLPLIFVSGDVGEEIAAGKGKSIDWDIAQELVAFEGDLTFEVRALITFSPIDVTFPDQGSIRRGTTQQITWLGSNLSEYVDIELFRDDKKVSTIARTQNDGSHAWTIPQDVKAGQGYTVKVSSTSSTQFDQGDYFSIRRRVPLLLKVVPAALIVPAVILILDDGGSGPEILPRPPDKPD